MDLTADFKTFQGQVQTALVAVTRTAGQIANEDLGFHRSSSEKLSRSLDRQNAHLLRLTNKLLKAVSKDTGNKPPTLQNQDGIDDNWRRVVDVVDNLLEKADSALDEVSGVLKRQSPAPQDGTLSPKQSGRVGRGFQRAFAPVTQKPQRSFDRKVNNADNAPFKALLQNKPHAIVPLEECIGDEQTGYKHPYAPEIENYTYPASVYQIQPPIPFTPAEDSQPIFIDTEEGVKEMVQELKQATEIAIDLEHNDQRSYIGMVCLMQISTRDKDWIIDTLKPWRENLQVLNEVFADPKILKLFHGSNMDMIWLQRDLGLYVVGLFDTYHASVALQFPGKGLKHLLERFANFEAQKQYQTADWRIRPLPVELVDYARSDTHFLLNIYDNIRNMLVEASTPNENLIDFVLRESKKEALQVYERPVYDMETGRGPLGWLGLLMQRSVSFSPQQFSVFRAVHEWRDRKARELDEGLQFIMSNNMVFQVAESMPMSAFNFHASCRGATKNIMGYLPELIEIIKKAKAEGTEGKSVQEVLKHSEEVYGIIPRPGRGPRKEKKEPQTTFQGLGATLRDLAASGDVGAATPTLNHDGPMDVDVPVAERSSASHFWGNVAPQYAHLPADAVTAINALAAVLPLAAATAEANLEAAPTQLLPEPTPSAAKTITQKQTAPKSSEIFTLNELSRSKKRKAADDEEEEDVDMIAPTPNGSSPADASASPLPDKPEYETQRQAKKQRKAEKKARKKAEKDAADAAAAAAQPFDYDAAESLLKPAAQATQQDGQAAKRMNPFAKALDASTGARRGKMGKELAGKSMTFKS
ncbi:exosome complex exonuclease Rrp6 [Exophiala viscosa]|uniref:exosome complex exonuclease Rrp6 n=1 Tax=Exophiala viscosa TaxID=2486360 RepID=UPI0021A0696F|nr:exosome complex exonuclease Rrp6 [Exophiala viscosa]